MKKFELNLYHISSEGGRFQVDAPSITNPIVAELKGENFRGEKKSKDNIKRRSSRKKSSFCSYNIQCFSSNYLCSSISPLGSSKLMSGIAV